VSKKHKKEKKHKKGKKDQGVNNGKNGVAVSIIAVTPAVEGAYADGMPLDRITYMEAKLILKPEPFISVDSFHDFGKIVQRTAKNSGVGFISDWETSMRPQIREITFLDTPDFRLYNNAFILRRRIAYVDGFPMGDPEIVFKFRHPDEQAAAAMDVRPRIAGKYEIKFKAEILPLKQEVGGYRILYSHNCQFGLSQMHDADKNSMTTLGHVFPALAPLVKEESEHVSLVNGGIVEEVLLPLGQLDFGKGLVGKCDIALWRTRGEHKSLVGEFSFQIKFANVATLAEKQKKLGPQFHVNLQHEVEGWLALGVTKTAMVYRLNGNEPQSHE
jgi:hypothetical protein